jgi:O-antigen/teichoic acid export membrane protein
VRPRSPLSVSVSAVFATRAVSLLLAAGTTFVLARVLGPVDLGGYYLLVLVPSSAMAIFSFGLPSALTYFSGRGDDLNEVRTLAILLGLACSAAIAAVLLVLGPVLYDTILAAAPQTLLPVALAATPGVFLTAFATAVILGQQRLRAYNALLLIQATCLFVAQVVTVVILKGGLAGALWTYAGTNLLAAILSVGAMIRLAPFRPTFRGGSARALLRYGTILQPASLAGFFSYRADVFLISLIMRNPAALGQYGVAVNLAELCFYVPDAVSTVLFPRVASSDRAEAAALVPPACRITLSLTMLAGAVLAAAALVGIPLLLPAYLPSLVPTFLLLPGIIGLSASKVLSGYLSGIGRPAPISAVASGALILNVLCNVLLIPILGIAGAAAASLISYSANGLAMARIGSRQAGVPLTAMIRLRAPDVAFLRAAVPRLIVAWKRR